MGDDPSARNSDLHEKTANWLTGLLTLGSIGLLPPAWYGLIWRYSELEWPGNLAVLFSVIVAVWVVIFMMTRRRRRSGVRAVDGVVALVIVGAECVVVLTLCVLAAVRGW
ncbi:hypothetical protein [Promicromonospora sp. NPDC050880]|uniref:hypothetical protein n=1 Tax=Promicromonospora sp. NPDC050880 TaxID=3364406 RepID=UPI0037A04BA3